MNHFRDFTDFILPLISYFANGERHQKKKGQDVDGELDCLPKTDCWFSRKLCSPLHTSWHGQILDLCFVQKCH